MSEVISQFFTVELTVFFCFYFYFGVLYLYAYCAVVLPMRT